MSIATELTLLANSKQAIKNSINQKGGSITDSTPFADYSTAIDNLPSGGSGNPMLTSIDVSDFTGTTFNTALSYITGVTIPSGVTSIENNAFAGFFSITSINIPNSVTSIGSNAFQNCSGLTSINIPTGVTSINYGTFSGCRKLTSISIPNTVTSIGDNAFSSSGLTIITIPDSVTTIGTWSFSGCASLVTATLPSTIASLPNSMFRNCSILTSINIPNTVTSIGTNVFDNCRLLKSVIVNSTTPPTLGSQAFVSTSCPIYVPAASVDAYKAATGWSTYASRIYPITQLATVDGNPVYNYELGNTDSTTILSTEMAKLPTGTSIEFAEGITNMGGEITGYTTVILPSTFTTFNDQDMIGSSVTTLTMKSTTPPMAERNKFGGSGLTAIYVPASAVDTYKADSGWSSFASIIQAIPTPSATSITMTYNETTNPGDWGDIGGCSETVNVDSFEAASANSTFDSDIKASDLVVVEDNLGNDVTSQCTFTSSDYTKTENSGTYNWSLDTYIGDADSAQPHSATITATYGNLSDTFTIEWTTTSNCSEPEPEEPEE